MWLQIPCIEHKALVSTVSSELLGFCFYFFLIFCFCAVRWTKLATSSALSASKYIVSYRIVVGEFLNL